MVVHGVQPDELPAVFPVVAPIIARIPRLVERYRYEDVRAEIESGSWQLWVMGQDQIDAVLLTSITQYPKTREMNLLGVAGRGMRQWIHLVSHIEEYATQNGCDRIVMSQVRKGFRKMLSDYTGDRIVLEKEL